MEPNNRSPDALQAELDRPPEGENFRRRCPNLECRTKLPAPVDNPRDAFCCRGCYEGFYRARCRICERPIEQPPRGGVRFTCNKAKCRNAWKGRFGLGRYPTLNRAESIQEVPGNKGPKVAIDDDRASWRVVAAGAPISAGQYYCAIVGAAAATAAAGQANAAHWRTAKAGRLGYRSLDLDTAPHRIGGAA
jgi:hypothetical protein